MKKYKNENNYRFYKNELKYNVFYCLLGAFILSAFFIIDPKHLVGDFDIIDYYISFPIGAILICYFGYRTLNNLKQK